MLLKYFIINDAIFYLLFLIVKWLNFFLRRYENKLLHLLMDTSKNYIFQVHVIAVEFPKKNQSLITTYSKKNCIFAKIYK